MITEMIQDNLDLSLWRRNPALYYNIFELKFIYSSFTRQLSIRRIKVSETWKTELLHSATEKLVCFNKYNKCFFATDLPWGLMTAIEKK